MKRNRVYISSSTDGLMEAIQEKDFIKAYSYALGLLARREYSSKEIRQKLSAKVSVEVCEAVIGRLQAENSLSDKRFVEMMLRHYVEGGYGPRRIALELYKRGIDRASINEAIEGLDIDWEEAAWLVLEQKFQELSRGSERKEQQRAYAFLVRRGFAESDAMKAFRKKLAASEL